MSKHQLKTAPSYKKKHSSTCGMKWRFQTEFSGFLCKLVGAPGLLTLVWSQVHSIQFGDLGFISSQDVIQEAQITIYLSKYFTVIHRSESKK